jgi:hypothetical protein
VALCDAGDGASEPCDMHEYISCASYLIGSLTLLRVNSANILDEGLRIGGKATTRDSGSEIGT